MGTDIIHAFGNHPDWDETHYFNFYDRKNDICGLMRIALLPNRKEKMMACFFTMPDGTVVSSRHKVDFDKKELAARNLRFEQIAPDRSWNLIHAGTMTRTAGSKLRQSQVEMNLRFDGLNDIFDYRECAPGMDISSNDSRSDGHIEQFGKITGRLSIGLDEFNIAALGGRYQTWGVRNTTEMKSWKWFNCQFSEECALNISKLTMGDSEIDAGFVYDGGKNIPITSAKIDTDYHVGRKPRSFKLSLNGKDGQIFIVTGRVVKNLELPSVNADEAEGSKTFEALAKYDMGEKMGYGMSEYLLR